MDAEVGAADRDPLGDRPGVAVRVRVVGRAGQDAVRRTPLAPLERGDRGARSRSASVRVGPPATAPGSGWTAPLRRSAAPPRAGGASRLGLGDRALAGSARPSAHSSSDASAGRALARLVGLGEPQLSTPCLLPGRVGHADPARPVILGGHPLRARPLHTDQHDGPRKGCGSRSPRSIPTVGDIEGNAALIAELDRARARRGRRTWSSSRSSACRATRPRTST